MKPITYIPFTNKGKPQFTKKLRVDTMTIRNTLRSNLSLARSFYGVVVPLSDHRKLAETKVAVSISKSAIKCPVKPTKHCATKKRVLCPPKKRKHRRKHTLNKHIKKKLMIYHKIKAIQVRTLEFIEQSFKGLTADNEFLYLPPQDTSLSTNIMYMIQNLSHDATLEIQVEVSPDEINYYLDTSGIKIKPNSNYVTTPSRFAKFTRVSFRTLEKDLQANVDVYYQTQTQPQITQQKNCKKAIIPH
ncbi:DUF6385 domain-containing protein [Paenibacillus sp. BR2-3]|uniref:DUF6385 domain-containing protein n=1 Tax=Paenibacillus sp. BR2-3 TaxID=3048494 RepID=UPI003977D561